MRSLAFALTALMMIVASATAQKKPKPPTQAEKDSAAAVMNAAAIPVGRLSWTSDRRPLRVGDLLTIVVDEQANASESSSAVAHATRSQTAQINSELAPAKLRSLGLGYDAKSDAAGEAGRSGDFTAVLSVRVTGLEPGGIAHIAGQKFVTIDGRKQELGIVGIVRAEDVAADNTVYSSRVADAVISYKGKKIGPSTGIIGKIVAILWP